jgi:hypothetical protein
MMLLILGRKADCHELLGLIEGGCLLVTFKKRSADLLVLDFINCPHCTGCALANNEELFAGADIDT